MILEIDLKTKIESKSIFILKQNHRDVKKGAKRYGRKIVSWCKRAKIAMIKNDIAVNDLSAELEYNRSYISSVLNGRVISPRCESVSVTF